MKLAMLLGFLLSFIGCQQEAVETIVEVPVPTAPPTGALPPLEPERPDFLNFDQLEQFALNDLNSLNETDRENTRYMIGCNFYNAGKQNLDFEQAGVNKGINGISTERLLTYSTAIDPTGCMWRVDISEFGATRLLWQDFERENLVGFISQSTRGVTLRFLTQTNQPIVFASSFFTTVLGADQLSNDNGLYYRFMRQAFTNVEFFDDIGFDVGAEFAQEDISCAGGGRSQIALGKTRMICICQGCTDDGYMLFTGDTSLVNPDSVLSNPFLIQQSEAAGGFATDKIFDFAASEFIFSLPNGLIMGYRLSNAGFELGPDIEQGTAETIAPTNVVIDIEQSGIGLAPDITLGACGNCHHQQAGIFFQDQVFNQVLQAGGFNAAEKNLVEVFFRNDTFQAKLSSANRQHTQALSEIGVSTLAEDPVVTGLIQPLRRELDAETVASYTFLPVDEFLTRLNGTNDAKIVFGPLISGGTVQFSDFANNYDLLINDLNLFRDRTL